MNNFVKKKDEKDKMNYWVKKNVKKITVIHILFWDNSKVNIRNWFFEQFKDLKGVSIELQSGIVVKNTIKH